MATPVSLVNKDIARHYQLANLLAPPEAIELTKLYNEMSNILSKPVKFRNKPMQLHLFYDLLSQYAQHLNNLKMDGNQIPPTIPEPPQNIETPTVQNTETQRAQNVTFDDDNFVDMDATMLDPQSTPKTSTPASSSSSSALVPFISQTPRQITLKTPKQPGTPLTEMSKYLKSMTKNIETPRKVFQLLVKNDPTFQWNPSDNSIIMQGKKFEGKHFINILENLRNPDLKPKNEETKFIVNYLTQTLQSEDPSSQAKFFSKLPALKQYFIKQPMQTRQTSKKLDLDSTSLTSTNIAQPKSMQEKKGKGRRKNRNINQPAKVHWKRWQTKIRYININIYINETTLKYE